MLGYGKENRDEDPYFLCGRYYELIGKTVDVISQCIEIAKDIFELVNQLHTVLIEQRGNFVLGLFLFIAPIIVAFQQHILR